MPPELRRLLRWTPPVLGAIILTYQFWNTWDFALAHAGESCMDTGCRLQMAGQYGAAYGLLLPAWFWLGRPRSMGLLLVALAGITISELWAARLIQHEDHGMMDVRAWGYYTLVLMGPALIGQLVRRYKMRKAAV